MRPVGPIDFLQTEPLKSFYLGFYDQDGRLKRFVKYLVQETKAGTHQLPEKSAPHALLYFEALIRNASEFDVGRAIPYADTEGKSMYFKGIVNGMGNQVDLQLVKRTTFFDDAYLYWPNGQLKERVMTKKDGTVLKTLFDEDGKELH